LSEIVFRQGRPGDAEAMTRFILDAAEAMIPWLFGPRHAEIIQDMVRADHGTVSHVNCIVCEIDGRVAGGVACFPSEAEEDLNKDIVPILRQYMGFFGLMRLGWRGSRFHRAFRKPDSSFYIQAISVHPDFRGKGIAGKLIGEVAKQAASAGCDSIALEVRSNNESALRAYEKAGFAKEYGVPISRFTKGYEGVEIWAMVKKL